MSAVAAAVQPVPKRSAFVSAVAWIFIALSGFGTFTGVLQNIVLNVTLRSPELEQAQQQAMQAMRSDPTVPPFFVSIASAINHALPFFPLIFFAFLLVAVFELIVSIGLLRRRNWARLCFIGFMVYSIVWQFAVPGFVIYLFVSASGQFSSQFADISAQGGPDMSDVLPVFIMMGVMFFAFSLAFCVLYGWIIKKLMSAPIRAEFS